MPLWETPLPGVLKGCETGEREGLDFNGIRKKAVDAYLIWSQSIETVLRHPPNRRTGQRQRHGSYGPVQDLFALLAGSSREDDGMRMLHLFVNGLLSLSHSLQPAMQYSSVFTTDADFLCDLGVQQ